MNFSNMNLKKIKIKVLNPEIYKGNAYNSNELVVSDDSTSINYITRTKQNNGIKFKVMNNNFKYIETGNAITIGDTTATIHYQKEDFIVGDHMVILRASWLNEYIGMYITLQLRKESFRYPPHARAFLKDYISETEIMMPIDETGNVDYKSIENYIKSFKISSNTVVYNIPDYFLNDGYTKACWYLDNINQEDFQMKYAKKYHNYGMNLSDRDWKDFNLVDFFKPVQSKGDIKINNVVEGDIPLISAIKSNNGYTRYILNGDGVAEKFNAGCLTADMFGHVFYQPKDFYSVSHGRVNILIPKQEINQYTGIFVAKLLEYQFETRNSYARMLTKELLEKCIIKMPIDENGAPDWEFMEKYIKSRPFSCNL